MSKSGCYVISFYTYGCWEEEEEEEEDVVSIFDMNHMWQIRDGMYGTGGKMKFPGFHLQMQLQRAGMGSAD